MPDQTQGPDVTATGSTGAAPSGTTDPAPSTGTGPATDTTSGPGTQTQTPAPSDQPERFLTLDDIEDPAVREAVEKILGPREKQMMQSYTKKTQAVSSQRQKVEAYDAFMKNPIEEITKMVTPYGFTLTRTGQQQGMGPQNSSTTVPEDWQPQTWEDVLSRATQRAEQTLLTKLAPILQPLYQSVEKINSNHIEGQLDAIDGNWRLYEDEIKANMKVAPTLIQTPDGIRKLYRMSVPEEVYHSQAVQQALKQLSNQASLAKRGGKTQTQHTQPVQKAAGSFSEAVQQAKEILARQGR